MALHETLKTPYRHQRRATAGAAVSLLGAGLLMGVV